MFCTKVLSTSTTPHVLWTTHPRLKYFSIHFSDHLLCIYQSLFTVYCNSLQPDYKFLGGRNDALHISVLPSMKSVYKHPTYFWSDSLMDAEIQGSLMIVKSCIKLLGKHTVGNDIPFVTAAGAGLGTTGVGAATGRMAGDLLVENDWTTNRQKRRGGYKKYRTYFNENNLSPKVTALL